MIIKRDWILTEQEDFCKNVLPRLDRFTEAMPFYLEGGLLCAWKIQGRYE
jgi:hypothetical protein